MIDIELMKGPKSEPQKMMETILANREWLDQHIQDLVGQYQVGEWVAISERKVVATGATAEEVKSALGQAIGAALVICIPDKDIPLPF